MGVLTALTCSSPLALGFTGGPPLRATGRIPGQGVHKGSLTMMPKASVCQEERPDRHPKANPYGRVWNCIASGRRVKKEACSVLSISQLAVPLTQTASDPFFPLWSGSICINCNSTRPSFPWPLVAESAADWGNHSWQPHGFACGGGAGMPGDRMCKVHFRELEQGERCLKLVALVLPDPEAGNRFP